jgi:hypothetical protein
MKTLHRSQIRLLLQQQFPTLNRRQWLFMSKQMKASLTQIQLRLQQQFPPLNQLQVLSLYQQVTAGG